MNLAVACCPRCVFLVVLLPSTRKLLAHMMPLGSITPRPNPEFTAALPEQGLQLPIPCPLLTLSTRSGWKVNVVGLPVAQQSAVVVASPFQESTCEVTFVPPMRR